MSHPETIEAFRATARRVPFAEAAIECPDAGCSFEDYRTEPAALWIYDHGTWIAELADGSFLLPLDRDTYIEDDRAPLEDTLFRWIEASL